MTFQFKVLYMKEAYEFLSRMDQKTRSKIIYNIDKASQTNDKELFKKLKGDILEFRTLYNKTQIRLFAFWDKSDKLETLVISTHGIIKKSDKTPENEIEKAENLKQQYYKLK